MLKLKSIAELIASPEARVYLPKEPDLQGWNSDHPVFDQLCAETNAKDIIEVGTWKGRSAMHFCRATTAIALGEKDEAEAQQEARIYCVDTWLGGIDHVLSELPVDDLQRDACGSPRLYHLFLRNFADVPDFAKRVFPIQNTSLNGARLLANAGISAELIYIDGSHEYQDVFADLCAYSQLLTEGGIIFGDDFRGFPGVFAAVLRFAHETDRKVEEVANNFWILRKA